MINKLIVNLIAVEAFANDIHYTCHGESFYAKHIFVDEIKFSEELDALKEVCLLGNDTRPLTNKEYFRNTIEILPQVSENDDKRNFKVLQGLIKNTLELIESFIESERTGSQNLIGGIAEKLQKFYGLLNLQVE